MDAQPRGSLARLMAHWVSLHPYNVVDLVRLASTPPPERLRGALARVVAERGLGDPTRADLTTAHGSLDEVLTHELNRPFDAGAPPVRAFVMGDTSAHHAGITMAHWIGDGLVCGRIVHEIVSDYVGLPSAPRPDFRHGRARSGPPYRWLRLLPLALLDSMSRLRRSRRITSPTSGDRDDLRVRVRTLDPDRSQLAALLAAARRRRVTLNDLLLAALTAEVAGATPERLHDRRDSVAVATIVDLRRRVGPPVDDAPGVRLGYFVTRLGPEGASSFEDLVRRTHEDARHGKTRRGTLPSLLEIAAAERSWKYVRADRKARFHANALVLTAGLSNLVLPPEWLASPLGDIIVEYRRAVPTGPMVPLALCALTAGGQMRVTLTARLTGFPSERVDRLAAALEGRLATLAATSGLGP